MINLGKNERAVATANAIMISLVELNCPKTHKIIVNV